jgi:hypothetical protein
MAMRFIFLPSLRGRFSAESGAAVNARNTGRHLHFHAFALFRRCYQSQIDGLWRFAAPFSFSRNS